MSEYLLDKWMNDVDLQVRNTKAWNVAVAENLEQDNVINEKIWWDMNKVKHLVNNNVPVLVQ